MRQKKRESIKDIYSSYGEFLSGNRLEVSKRFADVSAPEIVDRIEYLSRRCEGQRVLHFGCLDHPEIIREMVKGNCWLHGIISDVSNVCIGIDVNACGLDLVQKELNVRNVRLLDFASQMEQRDLAGLNEVHWDLILCPEMLEHITNHQRFLENLRMVSHRDTRLVVTVPNAFYFGKFINALRGFESINSDHKYWFTFYTLSRLLTANGWEPRKLLYYNSPQGTNWNHCLSRLASRVSRVFCNGLIVEATCLGFRESS